jgi:hypothetical protein
LSICNQIDYGYTAAIRFHPAWSASQADTSSELSGMGNQFQDKDNSIRDALANSIDEHLQGIEESDHVWLPINRLPEIINEKSVRSALEEAFKEDFPPTGSLTDKVESRAAKICKVYTHDMKGQHDEETETSLRRIFAILILLDRVRDISLFLNAGLADIDLPFNVQREVEGVRLTSHLSEEKRCVLGLGGQGHKARKLAEDFRFIQNQVFTPFFDFKVDGREIPFFHLPPKSTLPFIKIHHHEGSEGGYSTVFRVQIDPAHHNLKINPIRSTSKFDRLDASTSVRTGEGGPESNPPTHPSASSLEEAEYYNPEWALKRINKIGGKGLDTTVVRDEINSLVKASCGFESGHVIKLFATYHRNGQWYLLFPWAEDDLLAFWEKEDPRKSSLGPLPLVTWIASQCRGLATGLRQIHRCRSSHGEWGIHRDIKPTNILRFRREKMFWLPGEPTEGDQLVISDLGFTRFHSKDSRSKAIMTGGSPCYMGPEYHGCISRAYDIWSLACVYIEFITWYIVGGSKGRDHFSQLRRHWTTRDGQNFTEDKYFYFEPESKTAKLVPAVALVCVREVSAFF